METQAYARAKAEEILAASTAIPRLRKEVEAAQQEAASLESVRQEANLKAASSLLEQGKASPISLLVWTVIGIEESASPVERLPPAGAVSGLLEACCAVGAGLGEEGGGIRLLF